MSEFERWVDSSRDGEVRQLLLAGVADRPERHAVERALAGLVAAGGVATAATGVAAGTSTALTGVAAGSGFKSSTLSVAVIAKWFALGIVSGSVVGGGAGLIGHGLARPQATLVPPEVATHPARAPVATTPRPTATGATATASASTTASASANAVSVELSPLPVRSAHERAPSPESVPKLPSTASLGPPSAALREEVELIDAARRAVAARQIVLASSILDRYASTRVTGVLDREAELLDIQLFELQGRREAAARLARSYVARHPGDANAGRLRQAYELAPPEP